MIFFIISIILLIPIFTYVWNSGKLSATKKILEDEENKVEKLSAEMSWVKYEKECLLLNSNQWQKCAKMFNDSVTNNDGVINSDTLKEAQNLYQELYQKQPAPMSTPRQSL
jgi:hypothetical protein